MLDLRSLHYMVTLSRRLHYARAAEDLGLSQSALSRAVQSVERKFGIRLFDRDKSGVALTPQGRILIENATVLLASANDLERQMLMTAQGTEGRIRFGIAPMPARALLPGVLLDQLASAPRRSHDVVVRNVEALWPLLIAGEIEFFISGEGLAPDTPPVRREVLGTFPISLLVRNGHPLLEGARPGAIFPVVLSSRSGQPEVLPPDLQDLADGPPHIIESFETLAGIVARSDAIWLSSPVAVVDEIARGELEILRRPDRSMAHTYRMLMYSLDRRSPSPAARSLKQAFISQLSVVASKLEQKEPTVTQV